MACILKAIDGKNMPFVLLTGDHPVYILIIQIRNGTDGRFNKIIPIFHTQVAFISAISIFVSAGIIADKSVDQAMHGKQFRRIARTLQVTYESLQRWIMEMSIDKGNNFPEYLQEKITSIRAKSTDIDNIYASIIQDTNFDIFLEEWHANIEKTPVLEYWLSFMYMVEISIMNIHSIKLTNWEQFQDSLRLMIPWLQIYDKIHYGKWFPDFWAEISNLNKEITQCMPEIFSHSITGKPYSSLPTNLWIEMTMNKGSKMKAGWQTILGNKNMLCANIRNTNYINQPQVILHKIADLEVY